MDSSSINLTSGTLYHIYLFTIKTSLTVTNVYITSQFFWNLPFIPIIPHVTELCVYFN